MTPPLLGHRFRLRRSRRVAVIVGVRGRGRKQRLGYRFTRALRVRPTLYTHPFTSTRWVTPERFAARFVEVRRG